MFTAEVAWGIVRTVLAAAAGVLVTKGYVSADTLNQIIGAVGVIFVGVWSAISNRSGK
jgi:Na+-transporting methylmalonyl-CoA/oxaloacetate decarboxylase beta subunit